MHILVAVVLLNTTVHSNSTTTKFCRSRSFGDICQGSHVRCLSIFSKDFLSKTTRSSLFKFLMQLSSKGERKFEYLSRSHG